MQYWVNCIGLSHHIFACIRVDLRVLILHFVALRFVWESGFTLADEGVGVPMEGL